MTRGFIRLGNEIINGFLNGITREQFLTAIKEWERDTSISTRYFNCVSIGIPRKNRCPMENIND